MKNIYRLKRLAEYLSKSENMLTLPPQPIVFYDEKEHKGYECLYYSWVFLDLPWVHRGFHFESKLSIIVEDTLTSEKHLISIGANPVYKISSLGSPADPFKAATVTSALHYYSLTIEEFLHLFGKGLQQPEKFGGIIYPENVGANHISQNINYLIKINMKEKREEKYSRLLKFADFLASQEDPQEKEIASFEMQSKIPGEKEKIPVTSMYWIFSFLPDVFCEDPNDWYVDSFSGEVIYGSAEDPDKGDTISCVFSFFYLEGINEFKELFCVGNKLRGESTCNEIAENIVQWIKERKEND